jgi:hypothetical protein
MSSVVMLRGDRNEPADAGPVLGPAEVTGVSPHEVEVRLRRGGLATARIALGYPYDPRVGDEVLVIGDAEGHYVIGVLQGTGRSVLELPGDVDLRAVGGRLRLSGDQGVAIEGPAMDVRVDRLSVIADAVVQRFTSLRQRVVELLSVHAGERHAVIDGTSHEQSKRATILTEENVTVNGKAIYLG